MCCHVQTRQDPKASEEAILSGDPSPQNPTPYSPLSSTCPPQLSLLSVGWMSHAGLNQIDPRMLRTPPYSQEKEDEGQAVRGHIICLRVLACSCRGTTRFLGSLAGVRYL